MFNVIAIIAATASLGSSFQEPADWRQVDDSADFYSALDMTSIGGPQNARTARTVSVSTDPAGFPGYMVLDVVFDCEAHDPRRQGRLLCPRRQPCHGGGRAVGNRTDQ